MEPAQRPSINQHARAHSRTLRTALVANYPSMRAGESAAQTTALFYIPRRRDGDGPVMA